MYALYEECASQVATALAGPDSLALLACDWYWEQDAQHRFTVMLAPDDCEVDTEQCLGRARWDLPGVAAVSTGWKEHRALHEARLPFRNFQYSIPTRGGKGLRHMSASGQPRFAADGSFSGYYGVSRDITRQWREHVKLQDTEELLKMAASLGRFGAWSLELATGRMTWSDELNVIHGAPSDVHRLQREELLQHYAPEFRAPLRAALLRCQDQGHPFELDVQALTRVGATVWVRIIGVASRDLSGRIVRVQGAYQDIHEAKTISENYRALAQRLADANTELEARVLQRTAELEALNRDLATFSYTLAHDLRAPMAAIAGFSQALCESKEQELGPRSKHFAKRIVAASAQMNQMTDAILQLSRLSHSQMNRVPVNLSSIAHECLAELREKNPMRRVQCDVAPELVAPADAGLIRIALVNLLGNAWKYSGDRMDACIEFGADKGEDGTVHYYVRDNGVGFDPDEAERLFEPFYRVNDSGFEGTGVGLATVRRIITRHGGRVWADAVPGEGACFHFTLGE
jgi:signal transduction histidine kinase